MTIIQASLQDLTHRGREIQRLLRPISRATPGPAYSRPQVSTTTFRIGTHDGASVLGGTPYSLNYLSRVPDDVAWARSHSVKGCASYQCILGIVRLWPAWATLCSMDETWSEARVMDVTNRSQKRQKSSKIEILVVPIHLVLCPQLFVFTNYLHEKSANLELT